ncbi:MAG: peroxide stress protein YaaA [Actinobacteria bacterium]|nr:peroxide stress protein YaaA [Actinomycetota bacterium]
MTVVLLPPSETKKSSDSGPKLRLTSLAHPTLTAKREILTNQLQKVSAGPPKKAREILGLSAKQDFELERNQQLFSMGTARAWQIYTGVLYEALDPSSLTQTQLQKICDLTFVQSALFGLISLADAIPAYRLSADSVLPQKFCNACHLGRQKLFHITTRQLKAEFFEQLRSHKIQLTRLWISPKS